jgi:hypothetical protein
MRGERNVNILHVIESKSTKNGGGKEPAAAVALAPVPGAGNLH